MTTFYIAKRSPVGHQLLLRRWMQIRKSYKHVRRDIETKRYRRQWFWNADRWDQRHGENSNTVQTDM